MVGGDFNSYSQAIRNALGATTQATTTPTPTPTPVPVQQQPNTGTIRPLDIVRIMETPTTGANNVQLTVATGTGAYELWVRHGNPARYSRATMLSETDTMRIWEVRFQPGNRNPHDVEVFANRTYNVGGATRQNFRIAFNPAPFVMPVIVNLPDLNNVEQHLTNGIIAGLVRDQVRQWLSGANNWTRIPDEWGTWSTVTISQQMERQHEQLVQSIIRAWDTDPATSALGVSRAEMEAIVDRLNTFPFSNIRHAPSTDGQWQWLFFNTFHGNGQISAQGTSPNWTQEEWGINNIVHAYLAEILGRRLNYGRTLSYTIAELFIDSHTSHFSGMTDNTGLYHGLGDLAGYANLFSAARNGQEYFNTWVDLLIPVLNPSFTFNHNMFLRAQTHGGAMGWDWNDRTQQSVRRTAVDDDFRRVTGVHPDDSWQYFNDAWRSFGTATMPDVARTSGSRTFPFRFNATDLHRNNVTEASLGEKDLFFVHVTATWCGPCNHAAPSVATVSGEFGDRVGFISLLEDFSTSRDNALQWSRDYRGEYIMVDQHLSAFRPIINALNNLMPNEWGYPTSLLIDGSGNIIDIRVGSGDVASYRTFINNGLAQVARTNPTIRGSIFGSQDNRNQAARDFNNMIITLSDFANRHDTVFIPNWNGFGTLNEARGEGLQHLPSVLDPTNGGFLPLGMEWRFETSRFPFRFSTNDLHGNRVTETSLGEKALFFVHVTATWCGPCNDAAPAVAQVSREFGDRVGFISLLEDFSTNRNRALQWSRDFSGEYIMVNQHDSAFRPIMNILNDLLANQWGYPTSLLIDGNGNVLATRVGSGSVDAYRMFIESGLAQVAQAVPVQGASNAITTTQTSTATTAVTTQVQRNNARGVVTLCQVPEFQISNIGTFQTNGLVADAVRSHVQRYASQHGNHTAGAYNTTAELHRQSNELLQNILNVWEQDPATSIFGINRAGMEARLSRVSVFPYTAATNAGGGFWYPSTHEGWFATHRIDASGRRVQIPIDEVVHTFLYELFGRGGGYSMSLSHMKAEHLMGTREVNDQMLWNCCYTGFYWQIADRVGLHELFVQARLGQENFRQWINIQIREMNPSFNFDYDVLQRASLGVNAISRYTDTASAFTRESGINNPRQHFTGAWANFRTAVDSRNSQTQRNNAAQRFNETVQQAYNFTSRHNLAITWNYPGGIGGCECNPCLCDENNSCGAGSITQMLSVHDSGLPALNLAVPELGVDIVGNFR
jgi:thiol-disulfide isomerase/thioredoxin